MAETNDPDQFEERLSRTLGARVDGVRATASLLEATAQRATVRHRRKKGIVLSVAAVGVVGSLAAAAAIATAPTADRAGDDPAAPGSASNAGAPATLPSGGAPTAGTSSRRALSEPRTAMFTGGAVVNLGPRPEGAAAVELTMRCLSPGRIGYPDGVSLRCTEDDSSDEEVDSTLPLTLDPGQDQVEFTAATTVSWEITTTYLGPDEGPAATPPQEADPGPDPVAEDPVSPPSNCS